MIDLAENIELFELDTFIIGKISDDRSEDAYTSGGRAYERFEQICAEVKHFFSLEWDNDSMDMAVKIKNLERERDAIIGKEREVNFYKDRIRDYLQRQSLLDAWYPSYYEDLVDAVFHENWGIAGLAEWAYDYTPELMRSSSAKIIGDNIFFMINGRYKLMPQKISQDRRNQLKRALLLKTPKERLDSGFHEVYMERGNIRITIFSGDRTKKGQDVMVFRKYVLTDLSFEKMAELGTIPKEAIPLFKSMIEIGYNVMFAGAVRTGKSTFLVTWQKNEDPTLEGLTIATDPENDWAEIMPGAPIMQIVADGQDLENITKSLLRGDNDYVIIEECRDATAFNIALDITTTGTRRSKMTIHVNRAVDIPYRMASKITAHYGGDLNSIISQVFENWNYVFEFMQVESNKAEKKLAGISEFRYDPEYDQVSIHEICKYDPGKDIWTWKYDIGEDKAYYGRRFPEAFETMKKTLSDLEKASPLQGQNVIVPTYYHSKGGISA